MNYFQPGSISSSKMHALSKHIKDISWEETNNELSALLLEARKIFELKPKYNTLGRRIRSFPFLKITTNEKFQKLKSRSDQAKLVNTMVLSQINGLRKKLRK